jgi:hypothetical protein
MNITKIQINSNEIQREEFFFSYEQWSSTSKHLSNKIQAKKTPLHLDII